MLKSTIKKSEQNKRNIRGFSTNPLKATKPDNETLNRLTSSINDFINFFENQKIDKLIKNELGKDYPTLSCLIKERLFIRVF